MPEQHSGGGSTNDVTDENSEDASGETPETPAEETNADRRNSPTTQKDNNDTKGEQKHWLEYTAVFLSVLALATSAVGAGFSYWQATISTDANRISKTVQRASITINEFKIDQRQSQLKGDNSFFWWFSPIIENSGSTPTRDLVYLPIANICVNPMGLGAHQVVDCNFVSISQEPGDPEDEFSKNPRAVETGGHAVIGPHARFPIGGFGVPNNAIETLWNGNPFHFSGVIHYGDVLDPTIDHVTKFCYHIGVNKNPAGEYVPAYEFCRHWNCVDEECKEDRKSWEDDVARGIVPKPAVPPAGGIPFRAEVPQAPPQAPAGKSKE